MTAARRPKAVPDEPADEGRGRITLVTINGVAYTVPRRAPANVVVRYLWNAKEYGSDHAIIQAVEDLAGPAAIHAMMGYDALTDDQLNAVMDAVRQLLFGAVRGAAGN